MRTPLIVFVALALGATAPAFGHGGGLDKQGCHHDRKRGGYHCHGGGGSAPAQSSWTATPRARPASSSSWAPTSAAPAGGGAFANCSAARAAGAAPVRRGDPGYSRRLDRDGDGVGCE